MEGDILARMKSLHLRGEGELQEPSSFLFLHKHALFQIFVNLLKNNKMVGTNPF